jgi:hypothetical protein
MLGRRLSASIDAAGVEARVHERGIAFDAPDGEVRVRFDLPGLGRPLIRTGSGPISLEAPVALWSSGSLAVAEPLVRAALRDRLAVRPVGRGATTLALDFTDASAGPGADGTHTLDLTATTELSDRQLYDVVLHTDGQAGPLAVAPHALYFRESWTDFGLAHITDMHVARRIDGFRQLLRDAGLEAAADSMVNWNDRFRGFVRYANYLHSVGKLDLIIATGDLYDYKYEADDDRAGGGNAEFLAQLVLGLAPGPDFPDVEELRVPLCVVPGNHDYRSNPYRLILDWNSHLWYGKVRNYAGYHLGEDAAAELANRLEGSSGTGVPYVDADVASAMVAIDQDDAAYAQHIGHMGSFVLELGPHRIVMLDTEWDAGVANDPNEALGAKLGLSGEDERTFIGGSPNSHGISPDELRMAADALDETAESALVILGMHAPLFNMQGNTYPYFLRETQRPDQRHQPRSWMKYHDLEDTTNWFPAPRDHRATRWVKRGRSTDGLDLGVSRGEAEALLRRIVGADGTRRADVVLAGHTHRHNEFRVAVENGELFYYLDFYTQNPTSYYPTRYNTGFADATDETDVTFVDVVAGADPAWQPWTGPADRKWPRVVQVPPYPNPLNSASDKRGWWDNHRPLVLQTGALGPIEDPQVSFSGFRVLTVADNLIQTVHFVSAKRLEDNGWELPWEDAILMTAPTYVYLGRTEQFGVGPSESSPGACVAPSGLNDVVFRDSQGRLFELWRDVQGRTGTGDLSRASGAPPASVAAEPTLYFDTSTETWHLPYCGNDSAVYCMYWSTGAVGFEDLTGAAGAPGATGDPAGFYRSDANLHYVIYRSADGHLHALYWSGAAAAQWEDLTVAAGLPYASGDPAAYAAGTDNVVAYRGNDGHVHSVRWSDGPAVHDDLSGSAGTPQAAGRPVGYYTGVNTTHQFTYRGLDGHLYELWRVGSNPVNGWSITSAAGAPTAASDPAAYFNYTTNTKHVVYASSRGSLVRASWRPGSTPTWVDLTTTYGAPAASPSVPAAFLVAATNTEHVVYRGNNGHMYEFLSSYVDGPRGPVITDVGVIGVPPPQ